MRLADFEALIRRLCAEVPTQFFDGVAEVVVSPRTLPHPSRAEIFTLGECVPLPVELGSGVEGMQSRIVLYHGSFAALAAIQEGFDWRAEAWETLTHELRHHLEWRARAPDLENLDWAVEHNYARRQGDRFEPTFFLSGELRPDGFYQVEEDVFIDQIVPTLPQTVHFVWQGQSYSAPVPGDAALPCLLTMAGIADPPEGDLILVLRRRPGVRDLLHAPEPFQATVQAAMEAGIFRP